MKKCRACGGTYEALSRDNVPYAHVCPPIVTVTVTRAGKAAAVPLSDLQPADIVTVIRAGFPQQVAVSDVGANDLRLGDGSTARPNKRDENPVQAVQGDKVIPGIVSAGAGVDDVAAPLAVTREG